MKNILIITLIALAIRGNAQSDNHAFIDTVQYKILRVKPSATNAAIRTWDTAHVVYYDARIKSNKILLWLAGTNGTPLSIPVDFFNTALAQGYKVIALSYITVPAISQTCVGDVLDNYSDCAAEFRQKRIYGDNNFSLVRDEPQDAIVPRLTHLLQWLIKNDPSGGWSQYLNKEKSKPIWQKIAVAGQSQGGGMAQFLGQKETLARVISFSGGWDYSNSKEKKIASWYFNKATTPLENWFATYNTNEIAVKPLAEICTALQIPAAQIFALDKALLNATRSKESPNPYHGDGIRNTAYQSTWITMLGSGVDIKPQKLLYSDDFEAGYDTTKWFAELGKKPSNTVSVQNGAMVIDVDYGATVWFKKKLGDEWVIEFDRTVPMQGKPNDRLSDFNVFWQATDPYTGVLMGRDPKFSNYDSLSLYYVGMGGNDNTTTRFRKYQSTGNRELFQEYSDAAHLLEANKTYHCRIVFEKDTLFFYINGRLYFTFKDEKPLKTGYFGFRTVKSRQIIDNFKVYKIIKK